MTDYRELFAVGDIVQVDWDDWPAYPRGTLGTVIAVGKGEVWVSTTNRDGTPIYRSCWAGGKENPLHISKVTPISEEEMAKVRLGLQRLRRRVS